MKAFKNLEQIGKQFGCEKELKEWWKENIQILSVDNTITNEALHYYRNKSDFQSYDIERLGYKLGAEAIHFAEKQTQQDVYAQRTKYTLCIVKGGSDLGRILFRK